MAFHSIFFFFFLALVLATNPTSHSLPFILFHGILDECSSEVNTQLTEFLIETSGVEGQCIEIGNGITDSYEMPLANQIQIACDKVKELEHLKNGYNIVALSQGNLIGRGVVQFCDGAPPVKNFISLAGPHAGVSAVPLCDLLFGDSCQLIQQLVDSLVYTEDIQLSLTPASYYKLPNKIAEYLEHSIFLPKLNNERPDARNCTYKERFSSLDNLVLIMFANDTVLVPKETSWFGYYKDGTFDEVLPPQQTNLYTEDWIGLRSLDEAGKVKFYEVPGQHVNVTQSIAREYVVPFLQDLQPSKFAM